MRKLLKRFGVFGAITLALMGVGVAFAAWTATGGGSGYTQATTAQALTTVDVSANTADQLYPGGDGDVILRISNPNPYGVDVTSITGSGAILSGIAACDASNGVTFTNQSGTWHVNAGSTTDVTLTNAAHMSNASVDACQGATFTVPVSLSGLSNP